MSIKGTEHSVTIGCFLGWGDTPEEKQANKDKAYAAEWFERAEELGRRNHVVPKGK